MMPTPGITEKQRDITSGCLAVSLLLLVLELKLQRELDHSS